MRIPTKKKRKYRSNLIYQVIVPAFEVINVEGHGSLSNPYNVPIKVKAYKLPK